MFKRRNALWLIAVIIASLAACSDQGVSPIGENQFTTSGMLISIADVGPSAIVLSVDVSDSISADELSSMVSALGNSLSDPALIPQDGRITVATLVYGDTVAVITNPTPVTEQSLKDVILPDLDSLLTDRVVSGAGADLAGALAAADTILQAATVNDRHVFILGSGAADDPTAVEAACTNLGNAGVMVSAVGVDPDPAGATLLKGCATATGGFFGAGETDLGELCAEAFAYMLQVDVDLEPENGDKPRGESYTVTAKVFRGGDPDSYPVAGQDVTITVVAGPNALTTTTGKTDVDGVVTLTYTGDGGPGTDTIVAETLHPGTGSTLSDTVTVTWINSPPTCDAGGPYHATFDTDTVTVTLDASASSDAEGDSLRYLWQVDCEDARFDDATSATPVLTLTGECLCVDSLLVNLHVSDGFDTTSCDATLFLHDIRPPTIEVREDPLRMWPPNHKYREVTADMMLVAAYDACDIPIDISRAVIVEVRCDEPVNDNGDGNTEPDIMVMCPNSVDLRAERAGGGDGRVYTIVYRITGDNGVSAEAEAKVFVPHDASNDHAAEGDGGYTVPGCGGDN